MTYHSTCTCNQHLSKTYTDRLFGFNVDTLFELLFGDNSFTRAFRKAQKLTGNDRCVRQGSQESVVLLDYSAGDWTWNAATKRRERQTFYKTVTQSLLGSSALSCHEKQVDRLDSSVAQATHSICRQWILKSHTPCTSSTARCTTKE